MKITTKTIMAFLTAMTMTAGAMGVTAYAAETNTAVIAENIQTEGIFSQGAKYHFIKGSDTLILDGEGTFSAEEFDEIVMQFSPRAIVFGDSVDIPDSDSANNTWLKDMLELSAPYAVYAHKSSNINKSYEKMIDALEDDLKAKGLNPEEVKIWINFQLNLIDDNVDLYKSFTYDQVIIDRGAEMEKYIVDHDVREEIAREVVSYYMYGLNRRVNTGKNHPEYKEIANADGTEINERTKNNIFGMCLDAAQGEQDLIDNTKTPVNAVSKFLAENGIDNNENKRITLLYVTGCKESLAFSVFNVWYDDEPTFTPYLPADDTDEINDQVTNTVTVGTEAATVNEGTETSTAPNEPVEEITFSEKSADMLLKGDADLNGEVSLTDVVVVSKNNLSNEAYPLVNETAYENADMNNDSKVNGLDTSALIENQIGKKDN